MTGLTKESYEYIKRRFKPILDQYGLEIGCSPFGAELGKVTPYIRKIE